MRNNKDQRSIFWYFHRPAYWLTNILIFVIFLVTSIVIFSFLTLQEVTKVNKLCTSISRASDGIEKEVISAASELRIISIFDSDNPMSAC